jgi:hypothetical protein
MSDLKVGRIEQLTHTHTPGPWEWFTTSDVSRPHVKFLKAASGQGFAHTVGLHEPVDTANANLIAAAPDLLAALKAIVAVLQKEAPGTALNHYQYDAIGIQAHAAIAKAEGR